VRARAGAWLAPATGEAVAHPALMARAAAAGVVLLGETHDRADHHRWQLSVLAGLLAHRADLVVGFEMFPAAADPVLAEWVAGTLSETAFLERADWGRVWGFAADLYVPLFHFCMLHRLPMLGLNCDRDLVRKVGAGGWEAVPEAAREGITPAAPATEGYRRYLFELTGGRREGRAAQHPMDPAFDRFVRAQQVWDRAFACRIAAARAHPETGPKQRVAPLVAGIIGRGHLEFRGGTPHQLADLGIPDAMVLLPVEAGADVAPGIADAVFGLAPPLE
jgi:uncharacterized iron-regulated protein